MDERIEMSDLGRLHGEIALGYFRVRGEIERLEDFPQLLAQALLHIILSHHGSLEHGSPVVPSTREAALVHAADNLGSKLGSFDRLERELDAGAQWADYDRGLGTVAYFGLGGASAADTPGAEPESVGAPLAAPDRRLRPACDRGRKRCCARPLEPANCGEFPV